MTLAGIDLVAVSRSLSQLVEGEGDIVDAFFERLEVVEVPSDPLGAGITVRREEGFAVRLARGREAWMATGDGFDSVRLHSALRQVARSWPQAAYPAPALEVEPWIDTPSGEEVQRFPALLTRALRQRLVAFPLQVRARRHRRWIQVVGPQLVPEAECESFYSIEATTPWGSFGRLATGLGEECAESLADSLCEAFAARGAESPTAGRYRVVLSAQAAAILLHEAVAHALEADTLAAGGNIEAAIGLSMGPAELNVLDDPTSAPDAVRRGSDDEGRSTGRRWLLRSGVVEQPLADAAWSQLSAALGPGSARRGDRNDPPTPRSSHLLLLEGGSSEADLLQTADLWVPEVTKGSLSVATGLCRLRIPHARKVVDGEPGEPVGSFVIEGRVADLLARVEAVGDTATETGAGWCAKGRRRVPVWATTPALCLADVETHR